MEARSDKGHHSSCFCDKRYIQLIGMLEQLIGMVEQLIGMLEQLIGMIEQLIGV